MKRIGIDVSVLANENKTGIGVYCFNLIDNLLLLNKTDKFILFAITPLDSSNEDINYFKKYSNVEIKIIRLPVQIFRRMFLLWQKINWPPIEYFIGKVDIFHSFNWLIPPQKSGKKIATFYDLSPILFPQWHLLQTTQIDKKRFERMSKMADLIITISQNSKKDFVEKYGERGIEVIYPGTSMGDRGNMGDIESPSTSLRVNKYILFVGTMEPRKNLDGLIKAYADLEAARQSTKNRSRDQIAHLGFVSRQSKSRDMDKDVRETASHFLIATDFAAPKLVIAGSKGWMFDQIYALPGKLGIEDRVKFLDFVSDEKLISLYKNALCLVYPSFYEGFGIPVLEAMSLGVPVICSNTSSFPEVGGKAVLYVDSHKVEDIVRALQKISEDENLRKSLIKKGFVQAKKFNWGESARKLNKLYIEIAASLRSLPAGRQACNDKVGNKNIHNMI